MEYFWSSKSKKMHKNTNCSDIFRFRLQCCRRATLLIKHEMHYLSRKASNRWSMFVLRDIKMATRTVGLFSQSVSKSSKCGCKAWMWPPLRLFNSEEYEPTFPSLYEYDSYPLGACCYTFRNPWGVFVWLWYLWRWCCVQIKRLNWIDSRHRGPPASPPEKCR